MAQAEVGDDVFGEDPTVLRLEEEGASLVGKEAALFVPSGTMGNQIAVLAHTGRGDEILADAQAHVYYYEVGSPAMLAGVQVRPVEGLLAPGALDRLLSALRPADLHFPRTRLICLENTFNRGGGTVLPSEDMAAIYTAALERDLAVHLDGARVFNAAVASGVPATDFTRHCDSVMFCLSKGLAAPVGSLLAGTKEFIGRARKYRKALGGGMRQVGVLAAAGLVALSRIPELAEDHRNARILAEGLSDMKGLEVDLETVHTNILVAKTVGRPASDVIAALSARGVRCVSFGPQLVRFVTHKDVNRRDIEYTLKIAQEVLC